MSRARRTRATKRPRTRTVYLAPVMDGEWIHPTPQRGFKMGCCDCGLIHRVDFRIIDGEAEFRATRLKVRVRK